MPERGFYMRKESRTGILLTLPSLLGLLAFYIIPFFVSLTYTFTQGVAERRFVGMANFRDLLRNPIFRQAVGNTISFLFLGVPVLLLLSVLLSVILAKGSFGWQRWALLLPFVLPAPSLAVAWRSIWGVGGGLDRLLELLGMPAANLLEKSAFPLLLVLYLLRNVGYICIILTSSIRALPVEYRESYCLDSSSETGYVCRILLPLISHTLLFAGVVAVVNYFLLFRDVYMIYGDVPPGTVYMLQHFMNNNFYKLNYQRLSAAAFLLALCLSGLAAAVLLAGRRLKWDVD